MIPRLRSSLQQPARDFTASIAMICTLAALVMVLVVVYIGFGRSPFARAIEPARVGVVSISTADENSLRVRHRDGRAMLEIASEVVPLTPAAIERWINAHGMADRRQVQVSIQVDPDMSGGEIASIISSLREQGFTDFVLATPD